jgi:hypothetical protein
MVIHQLSFRFSLDFTRFPLSSIPTSRCEFNGHPVPSCSTTSPCEVTLTLKVFADVDVGTLSHVSIGERDYLAGSASRERSRRR